jgi:hypothetical protein
MSSQSQDSFLSEQAFFPITHTHQPSILDYLILPRSNDTDRIVRPGYRNNSVIEKQIFF